MVFSSSSSTVKNVRNIWNIIKILRNVQREGLKISTAERLSKKIFVILISPSLLIFTFNNKPIFAFHFIRVGQAPSFFIGNFYTYSFYPPFSEIQPKLWTPFWGKGAFPPTLIDREILQMVTLCLYPFPPIVLPRIPSIRQAVLIKYRILEKVLGIMYATYDKQFCINIFSKFWNILKLSRKFWIIDKPFVKKINYPNNAYYILL